MKLLALILFSVFALKNTIGSHDSFNKVTGGNKVAIEDPSVLIWGRLGDEFVFYQQSTGYFYYLQYQGPLYLAQELRLVAYEGNALTIKFLNSGDVLQFKLNEANTNVLGIGKFQGERFKQTLLKSASNGLIDIADDNINELTCTCNKNGTGNSDADCQHGGEGTTECAASNEAGNCKVSCRSGFYACCNSAVSGGG